MTKEREPKIMYIRNENNQPVGCLAYRAFKDKGVIKFGHAIKHPNDACDKKMARHIAEQRLIKCGKMINCKFPTTVNDLLQRAMISLELQYIYRPQFARACLTTFNALKKVESERASVCNS